MRPLFTAGQMDDDTPESGRVPRAGAQEQVFAQMDCQGCFMFSGEWRIGPYRMPFA